MLVPPIDSLIWNYPDVLSNRHNSLKKGLLGLLYLGNDSSLNSSINPKVRSANVTMGNR